jgi:uncharacterized membrane protein
VVRPGALAAPHAQQPKAVSIVFSSECFSAQLRAARFCALLALFAWDEPAAVWRLIGGLPYLVGTIGATMVCNVPRNDALAAVDPTREQGAQLWDGYVRSSGP